MTTKTKKKTDDRRKRQAIDAQRGNYFMIDADQCLIAGVDTDDGPEHPCYQKHATRPVDDAFVQSIIRNNGNFQLIDVWKDPEGNIYVVAGRRRVIGIRLANKILVSQGCEPLRVKAVVLRDEPHRLLGVKIEENEQRSNTGAMDKARDANQYIQMGRSVEETAERFNVSTQTISNWTRLLDLAPEVQAAIESGKISWTAALRRCHGKPRNEQIDIVLGRAGDVPKMGRPAGPTKATVKKLVEAKKNVLHPMFLQAYRYFVGEITAKEAGLEDGDG